MTRFGRSLAIAGYLYHHNHRAQRAIECTECSGMELPPAGFMDALLRCTCSASSGCSCLFGSWQLAVRIFFFCVPRLAPRFIHPEASTRVFPLHCVHTILRHGSHRIACTLQRRRPQYPSTMRARRTRNATVDTPTGVNPNARGSLDSGSSN